MNNMKAKKTPLRMCIACREMKNKKELIRIVKNTDGEISLDFTGKKNGRGAYICPSKECIGKCIKTRAINKAFSCEVDKSVYEKIAEEFERGSAKG